MNNLSNLSNLNNLSNLGKRRKRAPYLLTLLLCALLPSAAWSADLGLTPEWLYDAVRWQARELSETYPDFRAILFKPPVTAAGEDGTFSGSIGIRENVVMRYKCSEAGRLTEVRIGSSHNPSLPGWRIDIDHTVFSLMAAVLGALFTQSDAEWQAVSAMTLQAFEDFAKIEGEATFQREHATPRVRFLFTGTHGRAASVYALTLSAVK